MEGTKAADMAVCELSDMKPLCCDFPFLGEQTALTLGVKVTGSGGQGTLHGR